MQRSFLELQTVPMDRVLAKNWGYYKHLFENNIFSKTFFATRRDGFIVHLSEIRFKLLYVILFFIRCRTSRNFPEECFCWDRVCAHPYLPLHKIFMKLKSQGEEFKQIYPGIDKDVREEAQPFSKKINFPILMQQQNWSYPIFLAWHDHL